MNPRSSTSTRSPQPWTSQTSRPGKPQAGQESRPPNRRISKSTPRYRRGVFRAPKTPPNWRQNQSLSRYIRHRLTPSCLAMAATTRNQRHRASGLNLVVAAIVLWNTVYGARGRRDPRNRAGDARRNACPPVTAEVGAHQLDRRLLEKGCWASKWQVAHAKESDPVFRP